MEKLKGKKVQFTCSRITVGNPVEGVVIFEEKEWFAVKLSKDIEGLVTTWGAGETKHFRKSLINGKIKII